MSPKIQYAQPGPARPGPAVIDTDNRKSRNHESRNFCDFRRLPWFLPNAVICWFHQIVQYLLSINLRCDFGTKLILSTSSVAVASCSPVPKFTHFSYFLTKLVPCLQRLRWVNDAVTTAVYLQRAGVHCLHTLSLHVGCSSLTTVPYLLFFDVTVQWICEFIR